MYFVFKNHAQLHLLSQAAADEMTIMTLLLIPLGPIQSLSTYYNSSHLRRDKDTYLLYFPVVARFSYITRSE